MALHGITQTGETLSYYMRLQEVTANNLANANTDAFKAVRLAAHMLPGVTHPVPVESHDLRQGDLRETARPLDLALDGPGFIVVRTLQGERLMRGGSLKLDAAGRLTDQRGDLVLGTEGPLVLQGADVTFESDGTVRVDDRRVGRLRLVTVEDPGTLAKEGGGRFLASTNLLPAPDSTQVRQGVIEQANLDPLLSMVDLITIQRAYAANIDVLRAMDSVLGTVTGEVGKVE